MRSAWTGVVAGALWAVLAGSATAAVVYVDAANLAGTWDGKSWATAFPGVQMGLDEAMRNIQSNREVWVAEGLYVQKLQLREDFGIALYGGFAGNETLREQRNPALHPTVLDGSVGGSVLDVTARGFVLDGFVIRNADYGINAHPGDGVVAHCVISGSKVLGVTVSGGSVTLRDCILKGNGVGAAVNAGSLRVANCTVADNTGAGLLALAGGWLGVANSIVAFNQTGIRTDPNVPYPRLWRNDVVSNSTANYSVLFPRTGQDGNISADPLFVNRTAGDYRLLPGSPCIDAGDDASTVVGGRDVAWRPRIAGSHTDVGAHEYNAALLTVEDARAALRAAGGLLSASAADVARLNVEPGSPRVDLRDAVRIARKVAGLEANP